MWGVEEWKAFGTVLSGAATALGVAGGAWYFLAQNRRGSHMPNLSISLSCERRQSKEDGADWLAITATLKKLDRGTLGLSFARAEISEGVNRRESALWGVGLVAREGLPLYHAIKRGGKETNDLDWESDHAEPLNLTPGEETQISALCQVRANAAYQVKVVIVAFQYGFQRFGQWQASAVSLPRERERESARPPVGPSELEHQTETVRLGVVNKRSAARALNLDASQADVHRSPLARFVEVIRSWPYRL